MITIRSCFLILLISALTFKAYSYSDSVKISVITGKKPLEFNISDVKYQDKYDKLSSKDFQVKLYIPVITEIVLMVMDSNEVIKKILLNDKFFSSGIYKVKWNMNDMPNGKYFLEFITDQFIYRKDFSIKK